MGVKVFYRYQIIPASSAVSLNVAATNSGTFVEALQGPSRSLTGVPVGSARLGYELNLARVSIKLGASASYGPRNDQTRRELAEADALRVRRARVRRRRSSSAGEYVAHPRSEESARTSS